MQSNNKPFSFSTSYGSILKSLNRKGFDRHNEGFNFLKASPRFSFGFIAMVLFFGSLHENIRLGLTSEAFALTGGGIIIKCYCLIFVIIWKKLNKLNQLIDEMEDLTNFYLNQAPSVRSIVQNGIDFPTKLIRLWMPTLHIIPVSFLLYWVGFLMYNLLNGHYDTTHMLFNVILPGNRQNLSPYNELVNVFLSVVVYFVTNGNGAWNGLIFTLLIFIKYQLDAINDSIKNLFTNLDQDDYVETVIDRVSLIIQWHQRIIKFTDLVRNVISAYIGIIYVYGGVILCICLYIILNFVKNGTGSVQAFLVFPAVVVIIFGLCILGNNVSISSTNIAMTIYHCNWESYHSIQIRRILLIMMLRSQTPLQVVGAGIVVLNLSTFTAIANATYTYFTFLRSSSK